jgi:hypothetical protein
LQPAWRSTLSAGRQLGDSHADSVGLPGTNMTSELMPILNASSAMTKDHIRKTAVLGVTGVKRTLADLLTRLTGQQLKYFDSETAAKDWLVAD